MTAEEHGGSRSGFDPGLRDVPHGADWRRIDFHLHSPGVKSFSCPNGADIQSEAGRRAVAAQYASQLRTAGISLCALTDYNGVHRDWFYPIRDEARSRGIIVFPGIELSLNTGKCGLHILAIFEEDADLDGINSFILSQDRNPSRALFSQDRTHVDIDPKFPVAEILQSLRGRFKCLLIPAHPDGAKGLMQSMQPGEAAKLLSEVQPDAVEHCPQNVIGQLVSTSLLDSTFFDRLAFVEFSDPHRIEDIGTRTGQDGTPRATYLKLSANDLSAIRLALHDRKTRLVIGSVPVTIHARVRRIEITGSGFLGNLAIAWNDDLNIVIGGRGAGKSALLESLRYALDMTPYADQPYREELIRHALGSGGKVSLIMERPGGNGRPMRYRVERVLDEDPRVYDMGSQMIVPVHPSDLLGPEARPTIFGQREIYAVSGSDEFRLRLLDDLIGDEARRLSGEVRSCIEGVAENSRRILDAKRTLAKREEHRQRMQTIEHEIAFYEKHGLAEKLKYATALRGDGQVLTGSLNALKNAQQVWCDAQDRIASPLSSTIRDLTKGKSSQKQILNNAATVIEKLAEELHRLFSAGLDRIDAASRELESLVTQWKAGIRPLEDEINKIKQEAHTESLDPDRLLRLTEEKAALGPLIDELNRVDTGLAQLRKTRSNLLADLQDRRLAEHTLRRQRADAIGKQLGDRLRLTVEYKGQREEYRQRLASLLRGSGVSADAIQKIAESNGTDGLTLATSTRGGSAELQSRFGVTSGMSERVVKWLTDEESRLFDLETLIPHDSLQLELKVEGEYRPLDKLSVGQRSTAVLLLLFALEERVMILDQPEDDLDNRFVYEDIVSILRQQKGLVEGSKRRQVIAATHNANIPVLGDAELVLALDAREGRAHIIHRGSIDEKETRGLIKQIMEGGEEAFRRRAEKYGWVWRTTDEPS